MLSKSEPHRENLRDDYDRIAAKGSRTKRSSALEKWFVVAKIPTFYIMIDGDYRNCGNLSKWQITPATAVIN